MRNTQSEAKTGTRRRRSLQEADGILEGYARSGLTQRVFARRVGIGVSTLQYWLRRQARRPMKSDPIEAGSSETLSKVSLLEVELDGGREDERVWRDGYEVEWACGLRVRVPSGFQAEEARRLLAIVKEVR
jgi:transposase-like protein